MSSFIKYQILLLIIFTPLIINADVRALPHSYVQASADDKYLFVMIAPIDIELDGKYESEENKQEAQRIRKTYPSSGMYLNDGSTQPLWTVDWHSVRAFVSSDGEHVVRTGGYQTEFSGEALTFFKRNETLRSYTIGDLIDFRPVPMLPGSIDWEQEMSLDDESQTFMLSTTIKDVYAFKYTSGEMLSSVRLVRIVGAILIVICISAFIFFFRNRENKKL